MDLPFAHPRWNFVYKDEAGLWRLCRTVESIYLDESNVVRCSRCKGRVLETGKTS